MDTAGQKHCNGGGNVKKWGGINFLGGMAAVGLWPTITVCGNDNRAGLSPTSGDGLATAVRRFPTVRTTDGERGGRGDLIQAVRGNANKHFKMFPTPTRADGRGGPGNSGREGGNNLRTEVKGALNPAWVEYLMGWPCNWTAPGPLAAPALAAWREAHATGTQWATDPAEAAGAAQVPRVIAKCDKRPARIRALGNGQVPACVVLAWQTLLFERP